MDSTISWQSSIPFSSILGLLLFLFAVSWISRSRRNNRATASKAPPVPEAGGAWPVIGHLRLLSGPEPPHATLAHMADKYGPIFALRLGVHQTLIVSSWEIAKECFTVNDRALAGRPKSVAFEVMGYNSGMFGLNSYGAYWRHVRKIATIQLLSNPRLDVLKYVVESEVKTAMKDTHGRWLELNSNEDVSLPVLTEMKKWFGEVSLNVLFRMVVGKRFGKGEGNDRIRKVFRDFFDLMGSFLIADAVPFLRWLDLGGQEKAMTKTAKELDQLAEVWLDEHKRKRDSGSGRFGAKHHDDFMDVLLSNVDEGEVIDGHDSDTMIKATCLSLMLAGTDTTTITLTWALSLLVNNPEVLKKAVKEIDREIGRERLTEESDLKNLSYLQAILKETMRLYPAAPLSLAHECMEDCIIGGFHVPSSTHLLTNLTKLHRDPRMYPDPLEFRPERFLTTHKGVDVRGQNFELIPFGAGRRMCPGISLALQVMQLTLANLLQCFDVFTPDDGGCVDMQEQVGLTNIKASPLDLLLTPRLSPHLYA